MTDVGGSFKVVDKAAYFEKIGYQPHPKQWLYHASQARFRVPCCGRRFGKSVMAARDKEPELLLPNKRAWIVGPTYDLGEKEFRVMWMDMIIGLGLGRDKRVRKAFNKKQGEMHIEFPWQTRVEVRSAEHADALVGERLHWAIMSEAARHKKDTFEHYIRAALADERGGADFPSTPVGQNWYHGVWGMGRNPNFPEYESWRFPSWENPYVYPLGEEDPEIALIRRTTLPEWFEQEIAADFTAFVGKIYPQWGEDKHVKRVEYNPAWPNYVAFDWGYVNPMAAIEFQIAPDDTIHVWREYYKSYKRLPDALREMQQRDQPDGYKIDMCFGDAADPEAVQTVNVLFAPCIGKPEAKANWRQGIERVQGFLAPREVEDLSDAVMPGDLEWADSQTVYGFYVDFGCTNTIREFNNYRAPESRRDINQREAAQKYDDHALDAIRYGLVHIYDFGCTSHLSDIYNMADFSALGNRAPSSELMAGPSSDGGGFFTLGGEMF